MPKKCLSFLCFIDALSSLIVINSSCSGIGLSLIDTMEREYLNIIIADDDTDDQFFLIEEIKKQEENHTLTSVYNGKELLDLLLKKGAYINNDSLKPDLILLDLNMPFIDGFAALSQIKKNKDLKNIPVFILSTSRRENDKTACKLLGADEFFSKPTEYANLKGIVGQILGKVAGRSLEN